MKDKNYRDVTSWAGDASWRAWLLSGLALVALVVSASVGCRTKTAGTQNKDYFTSGSREADQRASQRMAKAEQLTGSGEGAGEKGSKKAVKVEEGSEKSSEKGGTNKMLKVTAKQALFDRLGGEPGISNIVADFTPRALDDPRVNWERNGVKRGGFSFKSGESVTWKPTPTNVARLQKHMIQFLALATGGPAEYQGKEIKQSHANLHIDNPEFDAALGDLKATLDRLKVPNQEQKELLAVIESTRPQIVTER